MHAFMLEGKGEVAGKRRWRPHALQVSFAAAPFVLQRMASTADTTLDRKGLDSLHAIGQR